MARRWYVVQAKPNQESLAKAHLVQQRYQVFYPFYEKTVTRNGIESVIQLPLYPSYLFVKFDVRYDSWRPIFSTKGVLSILGSTEDSVAPVPKGFVEGLRKMARRNGCVELEESIKHTVAYMPGQKLEILSGAFQGMVGKCVESLKNRVVVFLTLLSRETRVVLKTDAVVGVAEPSGQGIGGSI